MEEQATQEKPKFSPSECVTLTEEIQRVRKAIQGLSPKEAEVWLENYVNDGIPPPKSDSMRSRTCALLTPEEEEAIDFSKLSLDDGCARDEKGFVAPIQQTIEGKPLPPPPPENENDLVGMKTFPLGTPEEELLAFEPPPELMDRWRKAQEIYERKFEPEEKAEKEEPSPKESRQMRRSHLRASRKTAKIKKN